MDGVRTELKADIAGVRVELAKVRTELQADIASVRAEVSAHRAETAQGFAKVENEFAGHADPKPPAKKRTVARARKRP